MRIVELTRDELLYLLSISEKIGGDGSESRIEKIRNTICDKLSDGIYGHGYRMGEASGELGVKSSGHIKVFSSLSPNDPYATLTIKENA